MAMKCEKEEWENHWSKINERLNSWKNCCLKAKGKLKKSKKLISEEKQAWENVAEELFECQKLVVFEDEEGFKNELR